MKHNIGFIYGFWPWCPPDSDNLPGVPGTSGKDGHLLVETHPEPSGHIRNGVEHIVRVGNVDLGLVMPGNPAS